jgi:hypothetical protein
MKRRLELKLSSLDKNAPPDVEVVIRLQTKAVRSGGRFTPPIRIADYPASKIDEAQAHSDRLMSKSQDHGFVTWWRKDGRHVNKWPTMMTGKRRHFVVNLPYTPAVADAKWKSYLLRGVLRELQEQGMLLRPSDVRVRIDDARNRGERSPIGQDIATLREFFEAYIGADNDSKPFRHIGCTAAQLERMMSIVDSLAGRVEPQVTFCVWDGAAVVYSDEDRQRCLDWVLAAEAVHRGKGTPPPRYRVLPLGGGLV